MWTLRLAFISVAPLLAISVASATTFFGNPALGFRVDRPQGDYIDGSVTLEKVVVQHCGGGSSTYSVNKVIDPVAGYSVDIGAGNHCAAVFHWDTPLVVNGPGYTVEYDQSTTVIALSDDIDPKHLTPCDVTAGSMSGGCPWLLSHVN